MPNDAPTYVAQPALESPTSSPPTLPQTPMRTRPPHLEGVDSTPASHGSSVRQAYDDEGDAQYERADYDAYIEEDLKTSRVFMHVEDFMEVVLNIPMDWRTDVKLQADIKAVLDDEVFSTTLATYLASCAKPQGHENRLYQLRVDLYNSALRVLGKRDPLDPSIPSFNYFRNDPRHLSNGVFSHGLSPDLATLFTAAKEDHGNDQPVHWVQVPHLEEVKDTDTSLFTGESCPRVLKDGIDPMATKKQPIRSKNQRSSDKNEQAPPAASKSKKRGLDDDNDEDPPSKVTRNSEADFTSNRITTQSEKKKEDEEVKADAQTQCGRYAMEQLSNVLLRSHFIMTLCDRDRVQLQYYDRSVISISSPIDMSTLEGQTLFVLMVIGLRRLKPEDRGFRDVVKDSARFWKEFLFNSQQVGEGTHRNAKNLFNGMVLPTDTGDYTLGEIIFRQPGLIGRTTCVVRAIDSKGQSVVLKISSPVVTRRSEAELLARAKGYAQVQSDDEITHTWALDHLPNLFDSEDFPFDSTSVPAKMAKFLQNATYADGKSFVYEERVLRVDVLEELYPLKSLTNAGDIAQVFFDILQVHKWLYDYPKILHRDISMGNIMFRFDSQNKVCGVLNDFDLASLRSDLVDGIATSLRRTGTPPFMALDLQRPTPISHIYRHDLESLFYVACVLVVRHELRKTMIPTGKILRVKGRNVKETKEVWSIRSRPTSHLKTWFNPKITWQTLAKDKQDFFQNMPENDVVSMVSPSLQDLGSCVAELRLLFVNGFAAKNTALMPRSLFLPATAAPQPFDSHSLGGFVTYQLLETVMLGTSPRTLRKRFQNPL